MKNSDKRREVYNFLDKLAINYRVQEHVAVFTVAESSDVLAEKVPVKSLLVTEDRGDRRWMVIMRGEERLDMKRLAAQLGVKKLRFVKPEDVEVLVGVKPGSVSLFGLLNDTAHRLEVVVDETLLAEEELGFHPNNNTATVFVSSHDVRRVVDQTGHVLTAMRVY